MFSTYTTKTPRVIIQIARLSAFDRFDQGQQYKKRMSILSPKGNQRFFGSCSDDTKHGGGGSALCAHLLITALDAEVDVDDADPTNPWMVRMQNIVQCNTAAVTKDAEGNSNLNVQVMIENIPVEALVSYFGNCSDNANDAIKESKLTFTKIQGHLQTTIGDYIVVLHGVIRRPVHVGDGFHVDQLMIKHFSEAACGKTEKCKHEQDHHRQMVQTIFDIFCRDPVVIRRKMVDILGPELVKKLGIPEPRKERDTRWMSNAFAGMNFLTFYCVKDSEGTNFWVLLLRELQPLYSDWRATRVEELIKQVMNPSLIHNMYAEAEIADFQIIQHEWHGQNGEFADRPGFRMLELPALYYDHTFPFMQAMKNNWRSKFPETAKFADTIVDVELRTMKEEQLKHGINAAFEECAKMAKQLMVIGENTPWAFTLIMHPKVGPTILRVALAIAKGKGFDIDAIRDNEGHLIDENLTWGTSVADARDPTYTSFMKTWSTTADHVVHWLQQLGLMTSKVRNELKRLSQETTVIRDASSSTRLTDFSATYPQIFDMFWSKMQMIPHSSRIVEQGHGVERHAYNSQASYDSRTARINYIASAEYDNRRERRGHVLEQEAKAAANASTEQPKKKRKSSVKHDDRKSTQQMIGSQLLKHSEKYTKESIMERIPKSIRDQNSISSILKRGTDVSKKVHDEKKIAHADMLAEKRRNSTNWTQPSLEEQMEEAQSLIPAHDLAWQSRDAIKLANQLDKVLKKSYWQKVPASVFFEELKNVLPSFYSGIVCQMNKSTLLKKQTESSTAKNNLGLFLQLVRDIAEGKAKNTLSTRHRAQQLKRMNATKTDMWAEFVKVENSVYLSVLESNAADKNAPMRDLIESCGTEIAPLARYKNIEKKDLTTTYITDYTPPSYDDDDDDLME